MRALIAPDQFKGSLTATEVADAIAQGLKTAGVETVTLPLADGGRQRRGGSQSRLPPTRDPSPRR
jgi:glycerate kinase